MLSGSEDRESIFLSLCLASCSFRSSRVASLSAGLTGSSVRASAAATGFAVLRLCFLPLGLGADAASIVCLSMARMPEALAVEGGALSAATTAPLASASTPTSLFWPFEPVNFVLPRPRALGLPGPPLAPGLLLPFLRDVSDSDVTPLLLVGVAGTELASLLSGVSDFVPFLLPLGT